MLVLVFDVTTTLCFQVLTLSFHPCIQVEQNSGQRMSKHMWTVKQHRFWLQDDKLSHPKKGSQTHASIADAREVQEDL